jgi:hypothetical protein
MDGVAIVVTCDGVYWVNCEGQSRLGEDGKESEAEALSRSETCMHDLTSLRDLR